MNSFNHYAYGAIGDWMYRNIAGLDTDEEGAGYKKIRIRPHMGGNLNYAGAELETGYGKLTVYWKVNNGNFSMDVEIPSNTTASIFIPASSAASISENGKPLSDEKEIVVKAKAGNYIELQTGSGTYHFMTPTAN
jgi:alpha-L-rhamnosidase